MACFCSCDDLDGRVSRRQSIACLAVLVRIATDGWWLEENHVHCSDSIKHGRTVQDHLGPLVRLLDDDSVRSEQPVSKRRHSRHHSLRSAARPWPVQRQIGRDRRILQQRIDHPARWLQTEFVSCRLNPVDECIHSNPVSEPLPRTAFLAQPAFWRGLFEGTPGRLDLCRRAGGFSSRPLVAYNEPEFLQERYSKRVARVSSEAVN
jgi:hypothetical protein